MSVLVCDCWSRAVCLAIQSRSGQSSSVHPGPLWLTVASSDLSVCHQLRRHDIAIAIAIPIALIPLGSVSQSVIQLLALNLSVLFCPD